MRFALDVSLLLELSEKSIVRHHLRHTFSYVPEGIRFERVERTTTISSSKG